MLNSSKAGFAIDLTPKTHHCKLNIIVGGIKGKFKAPKVILGSLVVSVFRNKSYCII